MLHQSTVEDHRDGLRPAADAVVLGHEVVERGDDMWLELELDLTISLAVRLHRNLTGAGFEKSEELACQVIGLGRESGIADNPFEAFVFFLEGSRYVAAGRLDSFVAAQQRFYFGRGNLLLLSGHGFSSVN